MQHETNCKDLHSLLHLYNKEIDTLKSKLLNGTSWEDTQPTRKNITELAITIHKMNSQKTGDDLLAIKEVSSANGFL